MGGRFTAAPAVAVDRRVDGTAVAEEEEAARDSGLVVAAAAGPTAAELLVLAAADAVGLMNPPVMRGGREEPVTVATAAAVAAVAFAAAVLVVLELEPRREGVWPKFSLATGEASAAGVTPVAFIVARSGVTATDKPMAAGPVVLRRTGAAEELKTAAASSFTFSSITSPFSRSCSFSSPSTSISSPSLSSSASSLFTSSSAPSAAGVRAVPAVEDEVSFSSSFSTALL